MTKQEPDERKFFLATKEETVDYIADWKKQGGRLRIDPHLKVDRAFRNVSIRDCDYVLTTDTADTLQWPPEWDEKHKTEWDEKHKNHVLHIKGTDLDGESVEMLFRIDFPNFTIIVFNWLANV